MPWLAIDGEGIGRDPHRYVMMGRSDAAGTQDTIERPSGLRTKECLEWLLEAPNDLRICGYYLGYDWTKILQDLPDAAIYRLLRPELRLLPPEEGRGFVPVRWQGFRLHYLAGMMRIGRGAEKRTIWDLGKFFQAPFVDALAAWEILSPAAIAAMKKMKDERSLFTDSQTDSIRTYMLGECEALAKLAEALEEAHIDVGLTLKSYHGPGSTASALLKTMQIDKKRGEAPYEVQEAANYAFFGGRFEHNGIGDRLDCMGYDLVNAYVYESYNLPCLEHGKWRLTHDETALNNATHACVRYNIRDIGSGEPWGPLPCRLSNGTIVFPRSGSSGWIWLREYIMARTRFAGVEWGGMAWILHTECDCRPFAPILGMFKERIRLGKNGKGRIIKLATVSVYGQLARAVGKPKYDSRIWAGMITSGTRAKLLELVCAHKKRSSVCALATDGVYSTESVSLPKPPLDDCTLGSWEAKQQGTMTFVRPGIYWSHDGDVRSRGISRRQFREQRETVREAIDCEDNRANIGVSTLFGGARACVYKLKDGSYRRSRFFGEWHDIPAYISLLPEPKRRKDWSLHALSNVESAPYDRASVSDDAKALRALATIFWGNR